MLKKNLVQKFAAHIQIDGHELPVEIVLEPRRGSRFSVTRHKIIMRQPIGVSADVVRMEMTRLQEWVAELARKKPTVIEPFLAKHYHSGQRITVGTRTYLLDVVDEERNSHTARLVGDTIALRLSLKSNAKQRQKAIQTLLSRVVAGDFHQEIVQRVHEMNRRTFNRPITNVYLKYNHSNWGSCSTNGNVNLSTRLLFAPVEVQNYVILHELAHLIEMNHSDRFWALVESFMPDYPEKERWLKEHGGRCNF